MLVKPFSEFEKSATVIAGISKEKKYTLTVLFLTTTKLARFVDMKSSSTNLESRKVGMQ